jgi:hypothetical protein
VRREIGERGRLELVQMIENAGLMATEEALGLRIADMAGVAGELDARVQRHDGSHRFADRDLIHLI